MDDIWLCASTSKNFNSTVKSFQVLGHIVLTNPIVPGDVSEVFNFQFTNVVNKFQLLPASPSFSQTVRKLVLSYSKCNSSFELIAQVLFSKKDPECNDKRDSYFIYDFKISFVSNKNVFFFVYLKPM